MTATAAQGSIAKVLTSIFAEAPTDRLVPRREPKENKDRRTCDRQRHCKRIKHNTWEPHPDVIRLVALFLDPFEVQAWSCCCRKTRCVCLPIQLDQLFTTFRVLKRYGDAIHHSTASEDNCNWRIVIQVLLQALREFRNVYGPYEIHVLHAAIVGERILWAFAHHADEIGTSLRQPDNDVNEWLEAAADVSFLNLHGRAFVVLGRYSEYFFQDDWSVTGYLKDAVDEFLGAPRVLLEEGCLPMITVFGHEAEEHTDQVGLCFATEESTAGPPDHGDNSVPAEIFCLNYQDVCGDGDPMREWYNGIDRLEGCRSLAQAFCERIPWHHREDSIGDWTQLRRAAWLRAHRLPPFDGSTRGELLWQKVMDAAGSDELEGEVGAEDAHGNQLDTEVLHFDDEGDVEWEKRQTKFYLRQSHVFAKASDYIDRSS